MIRTPPRWFYLALAPPVQHGTVWAVTVSCPWRHLIGDPATDNKGEIWRFWLKQLRLGRVIMQSRLIDVPVEGGNLRLLVWGSGKHVAVALHGITASAMSWQGVARHMPTGWTLAAPDLRGRGHSRDLPGPYGLDRHVADVTAVLRHFGGAGVRPVLAGHSMGA